MKQLRETQNMIITHSNLSLEKALNPEADTDDIIILREQTDAYFRKERCLNKLLDYFDDHEEVISLLNHKH